MAQAISGIHHVTAIASDAQRNVDFYSQTLGLRLVKITVNYDDPGSYHLYYGDIEGSPGSILTFFAWPGGRRGRQGAAQATVASLAIGPDSLSYWEERFARLGVAAETQSGHNGARALAFQDPDGLYLRLVEDTGAARRPGWNGSDVPPDAAIRGVHGVTLTVRAANPTEKLLTDTLGFRLLDRSGSVSRFETSGDSAGRIVEVEESSGAYGAIAVGNIHNVAWRTPTDESQASWQQTLQEEGLGVSPVMDRQYFHSIYFREPGGVLFEIATDTPGFTVDEIANELGTHLKLPMNLAASREEIERLLPPLRLPGGGLLP